MYLRAKQRRQSAKYCLTFALKKEFEKASRIRQKLYSVYPPGSIGIDWTDFSKVWKKDSEFLKYMDEEGFSDLNNSVEYIQALRAGLFVDMLFGFKDLWGVKEALSRLNASRKSQGLPTEEMNCPLMQEFLKRLDWPRENPVIIYCHTKSKNIKARMYRAHVTWESNYTPQFFPKGEYDLGFMPGVSQKVIDDSRAWLKMYNLFEDMQQAGIEKFPKTFQTFEKHCRAKDAKFKAWEESYNQILNSRK